MEENLGNRVSAETISAITDRVLPEIKAWRSRSLDSVYPIVWMDAIHYKVMDERGCAVTRAIYNVLALDSEGHKDLLGMYISKNEGANFWLNVLTDLQTRGVCDILIASRMLSKVCFLILLSSSVLSIRYVTPSSMSAASTKKSS